jgi:hypothetical protein
VEIIAFALIPILAYAVHKFFALIPAVVVPIAIIIGFLLFYLVVAPGTFFANIELFLMDLLGGLVFGELTFLALSRSNP